VVLRTFPQNRSPLQRAAGCIPTWRSGDEIYTGNEAGSKNYGTQKPG
jgi:hypothetical protein